MSKTYLGICVAAAILIAGCSKAPTEQVAAAQQALEQARGAQADRYAADELSKAQAAFSQATDQIATQDKAFFLTRNYDEANRLLTEAVGELETAQKTAVGNKEKVKQEVESLTTETEAAIENAKAMLEKAPRGKDSRAELEAMKGDLDATSTALTEARAMYEKGDYLGAKASLTQSMQKAGEVTSNVELAMQKVKGARRQAR